MHGVHTDQFGAVFQMVQTQHLQPVLQHGQRQFAAGTGTGACVGNLPFTDKAISKADGGFQVRGARGAAGTGYLHAIGACFAQQDT